jgi:hypothetical protein
VDKASSSGGQRKIDDLSGVYILGNVIYNYGVSTNLGGDTMEVIAHWYRPSNSDKSQSTSSQLGSTTTNVVDADVEATVPIGVGGGANKVVCGLIGDAWFASTKNQSAFREGMKARGGIGVTSGLSKGGLTANALGQFFTAAKSQGCTDVILHIGLNGYSDAAKNIEEPLKQYKAMTTNMRVYILTIVKTQQPDMAAKYTSINNAIRQAALANNWTVVDVGASSKYSKYTEQKNGQGYHMQTSTEYREWINDFLTRIYGDIAVTQIASSANVTSRADKLYKYLCNNSFTSVQAAVITGTYYHESALNPMAGYSDVDGRFSGGIGAWHTTNYEKLVLYAKGVGKSPKDFDTQCGFTVKFVNAYATDRFNSAATLSDCTAAMMDVQLPLLYDAWLAGQEGSHYRNAKAKASATFKSKPRATSHSLQELKGTAYFKYCWKYVQAIAKKYNIPID